MIVMYIPKVSPKVYTGKTTRSPWEDGPPPRRPRGSTGAGHSFRLRCRMRSNMPASRCSFGTHNSGPSQLLHETRPGLVSGLLDEGVFCLLIESDCSMSFLCSSADLCLHLGIFLGLIDDKAEFFIRDLTICECPRDMVCDGVQFALREHSDLVMLFGLHWEPAADEFTGDTKEPTSQGCNFEP